jgi:hypothetical protein
MKTLIATTLVLAAAITSPAFAQHHANIPQYNAAIGASAEAPAPTFAPRVLYQRHPENDVYVNGDYVGSDPDPRIRLDLREEWRSEHLN